jgi:hypothetical protein
MSRVNERRVDGVLAVIDVVVFNPRPHGPVVTGPLASG